jgi:hypothetical protein
VPSAGPHGLWLDSGRLFCAADAGELVVLDSDSGEVLAQLPLPGVPDVVMHDPELRRLYVAVGDPGVVCSFDTERLVPVETVATEVGAHTIGWDPVGRRLYAFCPGSGGAVFEERGWATARRILAGQASARSCLRWVGADWRHPRCLASRTRPWCRSRRDPRRERSSRPIARYGDRVGAAGTAVSSW